MKIIRIGNDITIHWTITRGSSAEVFPAGTIVKLVDRDGVEQDCTYIASSGLVAITYLGKDQKKEGVYRLLLQENAGQSEMVTLDYIDAFSLSSKISGSTMIGSDPSTIVTTAVNLHSQVGVYQSVYSKSEIDAMLLGTAANPIILKSENKSYVDDEDFFDNVSEEGVYRGVLYNEEPFIPEPSQDTKLYSFKLEVHVDSDADTIVESFGWYDGCKTVTQTLTYNKYYFWPGYGETYNKPETKRRYGLLTKPIQWKAWENIDN